MSGKRSRAILEVSILAAAVASIVSCAHPPHKPANLARDDWSYLRQYVEWMVAEKMDLSDGPGLSIALVDDRGIIFSDGFGQVASQSAATPETVYRSGGLSRIVTVIAALQLNHEGAIDLDAPIASALPKLADHPVGQATLRQLITGHAGLPAKRLHGMWSTSKNVSTRSLAEIIDAGVIAAPGVVFNDSILGFDLVGAAIEKAAGRDFADVVDDRVLAPAGMERATFAGSSERAPPVVQRHSESNPNVRDRPALGLDASVTDWANLIQVLLSGRNQDDGSILPPTLLREMWTRQNKDVARDVGFPVGLGFMLGGLGDIDVQGAGLVAHLGATTLGYSAQLIVLPERRLGVVVLANAATLRPIVDDVAITTLTLALETRYGIEQPERQMVVEAVGAAVQVNPAAYAGRYATFLGPLAIEAKGDSLRANAFGYNMSLYPRTDGKLGLRYRLLGFIPISLGMFDNLGLACEQVGDDELLVAHDRAQSILLGSRIHPDSVPDAWRGRVGRWRVVKVEDEEVALAEVALNLEEDHLVFSYQTIEAPGFVRRDVLGRFKQNEAVILGIGNGYGEKIRVEVQDGVERLGYSGYWLERPR